MKPNMENILRAAAAALIAAGIFWTAYNFIQAGAFFEKMQGRRDTIAKLRATKQQNERIDSALSALASISNSVRPLAAAGAEMRELDPQALGQGLRAKRTEVKFMEIELGALPDFLHAAEAQVPPWRLAECVIESSPKADGIGSVTLIMEAVTRQP